MAPLRADVHLRIRYVALKTPFNAELLNCCGVTPFPIIGMPPDMALVAEIKFAVESVTRPALDCPDHSSHSAVIYYPGSATLLVAPVIDEQVSGPDVLSIGRTGVRISTKALLLLKFVAFNAHSAVDSKSGLLRCPLAHIHFLMANDTFELEDRYVPLLKTLGGDWLKHLVVDRVKRFTVFLLQHVSMAKPALS